MGEMQERLAEMKQGELQAAERELCTLLNAHAAVLLRGAVAGPAAWAAAQGTVRPASLTQCMLAVCVTAGAAERPEGSLLKQAPSCRRRRSLARLCRPLQRGASAARVQMLVALSAHDTCASQRWSCCRCCRLPPVDFAQGMFLPLPASL